MTKLYSDLAMVYHEMYQSIFDYKKEFKEHDSLLKEYGSKSVLEIGCGSGNLAKYFQKAGYDYVGLDLSDEMIDIAKKNNEGVAFVQGDMRSLDLEKKFDVIIITGRSFTYMTTNKDVNNALRSINRTLTASGILIFDNFDATEIFTNFFEELEHKSQHNGKSYTRISKNSKNLETGWTWDWNATYYIEEADKGTKIINDESILRAFTEDELRLFLELNGFKVLRVVKDGTFLFVAQKIDDDEK